MKKSYFLFFVLLLLLHACAGTKEAVRPVEISEIRNINIFDNEVQVDITGPFTYTIYKSPEDPFKSILEIQGVRPGNLRIGEKITSERGGISEIEPLLIEEQKGIKLVISLKAPLSEDSEVKDNVLYIRFKEVVSQETPLEEKVMVEPVVEATPPVTEEIKLPPARVINAIDLKRVDGSLEIRIKGDGIIEPNVFPLEGRIVVDIPGVILNATLPPHLFPLKGIRAGKHPDKTRIVFDLVEKSRFEMTALNETVLLKIYPERLEKEKEMDVEQPEERMEEKIAKKEEIKKPEPEETQLIPPQRYKGKKISLDFQDADITAILRLLGDVSGYNVVIHPDVKGKITLKLINVPWDQAMDLILKTHGLDAVIEGNVMRIAPHTVLAKEAEEKAKAQEAGIKAEPLVTRVYPVNFAKPGDVEKYIKDSKLITARGNITVDERTSTLIIKDVESAFPEIEKLLKSIDKPTPQILVEARIVEVNSSFVRELGIQWGINWLSPNTLMRIGGPTGMPGGSGFTGTNYMVNLPAAVSAGSGGAIGLGYINAQRTLSLDLQLSALEATGKGKIVSNPRIVTTDNNEATIKQGKQIPVQTVSAEGTQTTTLNAVLELKVKPHITPDGSIQMKLDTKKDEPDFTRLVSGVPTIDTKQATTEVLIKDGETLVIGGIFKKTEQESEGGVPLLSKIPILGWLFKKKRVSEDTNELMIFITPRIIR